MHPELAHALAHVHQRQLLAEAVTLRRHRVVPSRRMGLRRHLGHAIESLGTAFVALGRTIASA